MRTNHPHIITLPDPQLRQISVDADIEDKTTQQLIDDMHTAIADWEAGRQHEITVALAAIQIAVPKRIVIVRHSFKDKSDEKYDVYLNPVITRYEGEPEIELEGCLSVKDMYIEVARYPKIKIRATLIDGRTTKFIAKGFLARVFQHEIDHTYGIATIDRAGEHGALSRMDNEGHMKTLNADEKVQFLQQICPLSPQELKRRLG